MARLHLVLLIQVIGAACAMQPHQHPQLGQSPAVGVLSVCEFVSYGAEAIGKTVRVRGRLRSLEHGMFITDSGCPQNPLYLVAASGGPDPTLCSSEDLSERFGCPGGNDNGPILTVVGVVQKSFTSSVGLLIVKELKDFENLPAK